jgi:hypothetical protein
MKIVFACLLGGLIAATSGNMNGKYSITGSTLYKSKVRPLS